VRERERMRKEERDRERETTPTNFSNLLMEEKNSFSDIKLFLVNLIS
jgi:hypothetical protein